MTLAALIRGAAAGAIDFESDKSATATPATPATHERARGRTVATVATVAVANASGANPHSPLVEANADPLPDPAMEARRCRVVALLAANPALRLAVVCDAEGDPVPVAVAIRGKGTCEVHIPAARFDPFKLYELVARHGGTVH